MLTVNETLATYGAQALTLTELVQVILGDGEKAENLLKNQAEPFRLLHSSKETLKHFGLTDRQANKIMATIELVRRYNMNKGEAMVSVTCPQSVADYLMPQLRYLQHEEFIVMVVNTKNKLISTKSITQGTLTGSVVHPREVFKEAVIRNAAAIIVAHNHPSGDPQPSAEDKTITHMLLEAGKTMGIPLLDHLIIGNGQYYSFQEAGELK